MNNFVKFINNLENKYGKYAIPNISFYLTIFFTIGLVIQYLNHNFYYNFLALDINKLLHGEIWRLVTFLFYPPGGSGLLFQLLAIYIYYIFTKMLLISISDFKFNLYLILGILFQTIGGLIYKIITHNNIIISPSYFVFSILIAFCYTYSDSMMLFLFFIPIKAKYIAYFELIIYAIDFIKGGFGTKIIILASMVNIILYIYYIKKLQRL